MDALDKKILDTVQQEPRIKRQRLIAALQEDFDHSTNTLIKRVEDLVKEGAIRRSKNHTVRYVPINYDTDENMTEALHHTMCEIAKLASDSTKDHVRKYHYQQKRLLNENLVRLCSEIDCAIEDASTPYEATAKWYSDIMIECKEIEKFTAEELDGCICSLCRKEAFCTEGEEGMHLCSMCYDVSQKGMLVSLDMPRPPSKKDLDADAKDFRTYGVYLSQLVHTIESMLRDSKAESDKLSKDLRGVKRKSERNGVKAKLKILAGRNQSFVDDLRKIRKKCDSGAKPKGTDMESFADLICAKYFGWRPSVSQKSWLRLDGLDIFKQSDYNDHLEKIRMKCAKHQKDIRTLEEQLQLTKNQKEKSNMEERKKHMEDQIKYWNNVDNVWERFGADLTSEM